MGALPRKKAAVQSAAAKTERENLVDSDSYKDLDSPLIPSSNNKLMNCTPDFGQKEDK